MCLYFFVFVIYVYMSAPEILLFWLNGSLYLTKIYVFYCIVFEHWDSLCKASSEKMASLYCCILLWTFSYLSIRTSWAQVLFDYKGQNLIIMIRSWFIYRFEFVGKRQQATCMQWKSLRNPKCFAEDRYVIIGLHRVLIWFCLQYYWPLDSGFH